MSSNQIYTLKVEDVLTRQRSLETTTKAFERITEKLIKQRASKGASPHLDLVREVINLVPVYWLSNDIVRKFVLCLQIASAHSSHLDRATSQGWEESWGSFHRT
jgi:hypothetical protein